MPFWRKAKGFINAEEPSKAKEGRRQNSNRIHSHTHESCLSDEWFLMILSTAAHQPASLSLCPVQIFNYSVTTWCTKIQFLPGCRLRGSLHYSMQSENKERKNEIYPHEAWRWRMKFIMIMSPVHDFSPRSPAIVLMVICILITLNKAICLSLLAIYIELRYKVARQILMICAAENFNSSRRHFISIAMKFSHISWFSPRD